MSTVTTLIKIVEIFFSYSNSTNKLIAPNAPIKMKNLGKIIRKNLEVSSGLIVLKTVGAITLVWKIIIPTIIPWKSKLI